MQIRQKVCAKFAGRFFSLSTISYTVPENYGIQKIHRIKNENNIKLYLQWILSHLPSGYL